MTSRKIAFYDILCPRTAVHTYGGSTRTNFSIMSTKIYYTCTHINGEQCEVVGWQHPSFLTKRPISQRITGALRKAFPFVVRILRTVHKAHVLLIYHAKPANNIKSFASGARRYMSETNSAFSGPDSKRNGRLHLEKFVFSPGLVLSLARLCIQGIQRWNGSSRVSIVLKENHVCCRWLIGKYVGKLFGASARENRSV